MRMYHLSHHPNHPKPPKTPFTLSNFSFAGAVGRRFTARFVHASPHEAPDVLPKPAPQYWKGAAVIGVAIPLLGLGAWQTKRYFWKVDLLERREKAAKAPPARLAAVLARRTKSSAHRDDQANIVRVSGRGRLDEGNTVLVGPRPPPKSMPSDVLRSLAPVDRLGYLVVTPMFTPPSSSSPQECLVIRGWVPRSVAEGGEFSKRLRGDGVLDVREGILRVGESVGPWAPTSEVKELVTGSHIIPHLDLESIGKAIGREHPERMALIEHLQEEPPKTNPNNTSPWPFRRTLRSLDAGMVTPETHIGYAVTWFGLAIAASIIARKRLGPIHSRV